jgi:hypothetical protein
VPAGTAVTDQATLAGENASTAEGTVSYDVYSGSECSTLVTTAGTVAVRNVEVRAWEPETLYVPGTYYWQTLGGSTLARLHSGGRGISLVPAWSSAIASAPT